MIKNNRVKKIIFFSICVFLFFLAYALIPCHQDWTERFKEFDLKKDSLVFDESYDYAYVISPYEILVDRDGVDFSCYRTFDRNAQVESDEYYLLVFIKGGEIVADARVPWSSFGDRPPTKLIPYPK